MRHDTRPDVAMIAPYPRLGVRHGGHSGVASYTAHLTHSLARAGASVAVVAPTEAGEPASARDGDVLVERSFDYGPRAMVTAMRAARATGAPVLHLQHELFLYGGPAALPGLVGGLSAKRRQHRTVVTMHQVVNPRDVSRDYTQLHRVGVPAGVARAGISAVQRAVRSLADAVVVHERAFADIVRGATTIPHGMESVTPIDKAQARVELGLDDRPVALCFGFLAPYKGLETAATAARLVGDGVQVVMAGGPHPRLEQRHGYAAGLRAEYGDCVRFTGYVPDEDVHRWFAAADVAVLPYPTPHASSGPLALAIAHGTPVLASRALARTCGLPEKLAFGDAGDLVRRLRDLASGAQSCEDARAAVAELRADRSWDAVAQRHLAVYDSLRST